MKRFALVAALAASAVGCLNPPPLAELDGAECSDARTAPDAGVLIAGSGAVIPLARALLDGSDTPFVIADSIGSGGAIDALADGAIDIGLLSRPIRGNETRADYVVRGIARSQLGWAVHHDLPDTALTEAQLVRIYDGSDTHWPSGVRAVPIARERGDSGLEALRDVYPALVAAIERARDDGRALVAQTDGEALALLQQMPGAVGPVDTAMVRAARAPARPVLLTAANGGAAWRTLSLVYSTTRADDVAPLIERLTGQPELLARFGYVPAN